MEIVRPSAVAGLFYPADAEKLNNMIARNLQASTLRADMTPKALIVPHAGYVYSGLVAASAYKHLEARRDIIKRVVLIGPSHRVPFEGLAVSSVDWFETPMGLIPVDRHAESQIMKIEGVHVLEQAHAKEHSLEVQLPFLQYLLEDFKIVPIVAGHASPKLVAEVLDMLWDGPETLIVISSDLSHYLDYDSACEIDAETSQAIISMDNHVIDGYHACGSVGINGLLLYAREHNMQGQILDLRNSGDTAGKRDSVVGYGAYLFQ
ncbi:AmmeMemoRadiSam system protein B [Methylophaga sp.]|jgi:AmmeMemoRadiSam system protein B|uniref:AmmeMemoRadiSam system protein B n=1 Tax=Methylophaga sp. TaxID=2024840 RepID=UPI0013FFC304|nr:AmmeMemoRadiSam system protein B [Methylophaga sp.]MTI62449.1 AmmeMemoRadiSam system protein B [Methylophaga sp.]